MIAQQEAKWLGAQEVASEHILLGLIAEDVASKVGYLNIAGLRSEDVKAAVEALSGRKPTSVSPETINFSRATRRMFEIASNECKRNGVSYISPEHILLALLNTPDSSPTSARLVLESLKIDIRSVKVAAQKRLNADAEPAPKVPKKEKKEGKMLKEYCRDLCEKVRSNEIDPVIGRSREVARVTQILARRSKNNPILLGEPGVGKTAIAEGLALAIVNRCHQDGSPLPAFLYSKRVLQLDVGQVIAGAKERGELEKRVTALLEEARDDGDVILMIDEIHTLVGAGATARSGGGGLDISNLLKPALARGELTCIGATTLDEFRKHIEKDPALERRFQPVYVNEPTEGETLAIIRGLRERYERHHKCVYTEEAMEAAVRLSAKYIQDRFLPDKAIDLLDEAGSRARITAYNARRGKFESENPRLTEYLQVLDTKGEAVKDQLFEEASILQRRQAEYQGELSGAAAEGSSLPVVSRADIEGIVESWTGIPAESMGEDDKDRLLRLSSVMKEHVIGQDDAVDTLAFALMRARCGLKDPNRPVASMLFVGPTGVGKTEVAKVLAEAYFGSRDAMIRLDMSEYMERHSVSKLVGAPPGYIGYGEGGKLTEAVRRRPCCLVLMDEVEKAHPDVFNLLLQILEDGRLTDSAILEDWRLIDSAGRVVSFKNALIVLTSNIGARLISGAGSGSLSSRVRAAADADAAIQRAEEPQTVSEGQVQAYVARGEGGGGGDADFDDGDDTMYRNRRIEELVREEVKQHFRPELLNRLDEQIVFHKLSRSEVRTIAGLMTEEITRRVRERGFSLQLSSRLLDAIIRDGFSNEYGVRPLRNTFVRYVEDSLSEAMLRADPVIPAGSVITMDLVAGTGADVSVSHSLPGAPAGADRAAAPVMMVEELL
ncbi:hypothetical protein FOA52_013900 [Chlamydomonas sp. UWO 241]|nr:hypothetical protein FOA52_013900 [Chlamydomonas sp. UWO 241]